MRSEVLTVVLGVGGPKANNGSRRLIDNAPTRIAVVEATVPWAARKRLEPVAVPVTGIETGEMRSIAADTDPRIALIEGFAVLGMVSNVVWISHRELGRSFRPFTMYAFDHGWRLVMYSRYWKRPAGQECEAPERLVPLALRPRPSRLCPPFPSKTVSGASSWRGPPFPWASAERALEDGLPGRSRRGSAVCLLRRAGLTESTCNL